MSKHTPGPWLSTGTKVIAPHGRQSYPSAKAICSVIPYPRTHAAYTEARANAALIAAAPDALDALQSVVAFFDESGDQVIRTTGNDAWKVVFNEALAAIAKATA